MSVTTQPIKASKSQKKVMLKNYISVALRNIFRHKTFSFINIIGLGISMSVCLIIIMIVVDQYSFDTFHEKGDRIVRVITEQRKGVSVATSPYVLHEELEKYGMIEDRALLSTSVGGDVKYNENRVPLAGYFADQGVLRMFSFPVIYGNRDHLINPYSIVLTKAAATKLFGERDPVGEVLKLNDRGITPMGITVSKKSVDLGEYTVTGVIDMGEVKTHMKFDYLLSISSLESLINKEVLPQNSEPWLDYYRHYNYVLLRSTADISSLESAIQKISEEKMIDEDDPEFKATLQVQTLSSITPGNVFGNLMSFRMPKMGLQILIALALIIMFSACFNYTNLSVARALSRAREVGIRKSLGAERSQIFHQFLIEAVFISLFSLIFAVVLLQLLKPAFASLWFNKYLNLELSQGLVIYLLFLLFSLFVGFIAGFLPSFYLSKFKPLDVLKGKSGLKVFRRVNFRKVLIVGQFSLSLLFISLSVTLHYQYKHIHQVDYGYETESIVTVPLYDVNLDVFKKELQQYPTIKQSSAMQYVLASGISFGTSFMPEGEEGPSISADYVHVDPNYLDTYDIELLAGEFFDYTMESGNEKFIVISEQAVRDLGYSTNQEAVGEFVLMANAYSEEGPADREMKIIGVIADVQHQLLIDPDNNGLILRNNPDEYNFASIRINTAQRDEALANIENSWRKFDNEHSFEYEFLDEKLDSSYSLMNDIASIISLFSILAISISCLGLLGMVVYITENRTKEVGIRKALGAEESQLVLLLGKGFMVLLGLAVVLTMPVAWIANKSWLELFSDHIMFDAKIIMITVGIMAILGLSMILPQTWKSARVNPVDVLKED